MYKLCDTCNKIQINPETYNITSHNNERWQMFPYPLPILNRKSGSQITDIDFGKEKRGRLVYFWGSHPKEVDIPVSYPNPYEDSDNSGLVFLDNNGKATITHDCPQTYSDLGISYMSHLHFLISNKNNTKWEDRIYTQGILCSVDKNFVINALENNSHLIIDALSPEYFMKLSIPNAFNLFYEDAEKMNSVILKDIINSFIKSKLSKKLRNNLKYLKLTLEDTPIIVYCYDSKCNASHKLANALFKAGFTNVVKYTGGIMDWTNREEFEKKNSKKNSKNNSKNNSKKNSKKNRKNNNKK